MSLAPPRRTARIGELAATPTFARPFLLSIAARAPVAALALLLVVAVRDRAHSYAVGGVCSAAVAIGMALGGPFLGRIIDRIGQARGLVASALVVVGGIVAFAVAPASTPAAALVGLALVLGLGQPPVPSCARAIWRQALSRERFDLAVALDASLQELAFMAGPLVLVGAATVIGSRTALVATAVAFGVVVLAFAALPESRAVQGHGGPISWLSAGPLRVPAVRRMVVLALGFGATLGATELGVLVAAGDAGQERLTGVLFVVWSTGSLVAGLVASRRGFRSPAPRRIVALSAILVLASGVLVLAPSLDWLGAGLLVAGGAVAPLFAALYSHMSEVAPPATVTEAFTLQTSGLMAGVALGSATAGAVAATAGPAGAFAAASLAALGATGVAVVHAQATLPNDS